MNTPLVTCLCITRGRPDWLARAIDYYAYQDYGNKQLLIVGDLPSDLGNNWPGCLVYFTGLLGVDWWSLGEKRNFGCEMADSQYIATWDDDDYSAPGRISQQVAELERTGAAVTGYQSMKFTDGVGWWNFSCAPGFVIGSSLCFRRDWWLNHPFPALQVGEDSGFVSIAHQAGKLAACPDLGLMYATIHAGNTSKRDVSGPSWEALPGFEWKNRDRGVLDAWQKANQ